MIVNPLLKYGSNDDKIRPLYFLRKHYTSYRCNLWETNLAELTYHLSKFHGSEGRREPAIATEHINTRLHKTHGLVEKEQEKYITYITV